MAEVTATGSGGACGESDAQGEGDGSGEGSGEGSDGTLTWRRIWAETTASLGDRNHARWMCEIASGSGGAEFVDGLDQPATRRTVGHLDAMIARRLAGEPLQYVLGSWQFRTLDLMVDRRVLIPRPETEWVCDAALQIAHEIPSRPRRIVDLGAGSGAIGLSLAAELPVDSVEVWLTDVSPDALDVARANLIGIGRSAASVRLVEGSWFEALPDGLRGGVDLVVANPPYIADGDPDVEESVIGWEPHVALFSGDDGLRDIRVIVAESADWLAGTGWLVLEIGAAQGSVVSDLLKGAGFRHVEIRKDLSGLDRTAVARRDA